MGKTLYFSVWNLLFVSYIQVHLPCQGVRRSFLMST